jgi:hypothetical protein
VRHISLFVRRHLRATVKATLGFKNEVHHQLQ